MTQLEYDPSIKGYMIDKYPELSKYPEFADNIGDKLLRYCILFFDENSPLYKNRDLEDRRDRCYESVKADIELRREVESESEKYVSVLFRWFSLHHSYLFESWWSRKTDFHQNNIYLASSLAMLGDAEKALVQKKHIKANMESDMQALLGLENALFKDEKTKKMLTKAANENSLQGYPERQARNFFEEMK